MREASVSVEQLVREGRVTELAGIGKTLETKLGTLIETGDTTQAQKLRAQFPSGVIASSLANLTMMVWTERSRA